MRFKGYVFFVASLLFCSACDAPRDNPFDPDSANYQGASQGQGRISGRVAGLANTPLSGAFILSVSQADGRIFGDTSDTSGAYAISNLPIGQLELTCSLAGYVSQARNLSLAQNESSANNDFHLNALPVVESFEVLSHYYHRPPPIIPPIYYTIEAHAAIAERDGHNDLDSVKLVAEDIFQAALQYDSSEAFIHYYTLFVLQDSLPGQTVDAIRDVGFVCQAFDAGGAVASSPPAYVIHFFDDYSDPLGPSNFEIVYDYTAQLAWTNPDVPFDFTSIVNLSGLLGGISVSPWQQSGIPKDITTVLTDTLPTDTCQWSIEAIDDFGNTAQSVPSYFVAVHP